MAKVTMPQLGESVAEGTIGKWLKKPGDHVARYEPLLEVITDKVNAEVPSPFEGTLTEILVQETLHRRPQRHRLVELRVRTRPPGAEGHEVSSTQDPADGMSDGYLWNTVHDSFSLNRFKMTLASKPAAAPSKPGAAIVAPSTQSYPSHRPR